jgi:dCMP deaminase
VVYHEGYKDDSGLQFLLKAGVEVELITDLE